MLLIAIIIIVILIALLTTNYIKMYQINALHLSNNTSETFINKINNKTTSKSSQICRVDRVTGIKNDTIPAINSGTVMKDQEFNNKKNILAMYYADWCGISQAFKPTWKKVCEILEPGTTIAIDCEKNKELCNKIGINGYPTIILHKSNGQNIVFSEQRTLENIENFVKQNK